MWLKSSSGYPAKRSGEGFILVSVMLLVTLFLTASLGYAWFARSQLKRLGAEQFSARAKGISYAAILEVARGLQFDDNDYDSMQEPWFGLHLIPVPDLGILTVQISPLDDRFPINSLFLPDGATLRGEISYSWEKIWDLYGEERLGTLILDFIDRDSTPRLGSDERSGFLNRDLTDLSELTLIDQFPADLLVRGPGRPALQDFFTVWCGGKININVAPVQVLNMIDGIDETVASDIMALRETKALTGFDDISSGIPSFPSDILPRVVNLVGFESIYFKVTVEASSLQGDYKALYRAFLKKEGSGYRIIKWEEY